MTQKDPLYFEKIGGDLEKHVSLYDVERRARLILDDLLQGTRIPPGARMLEIGCATGRMTAHLKTLGADLTVNDLSEVRTRETAARYGCRELAGDCAALTVGDASFDAVVSSECIEHTPDPFKSLDEMKRVLKPGGLLVVTTPNKLWYPSLLISMWLRIRKFYGMEKWIWPSEAREWLVRNGFEDIRFSGCHLMPWILPFSRRVLPAFDRHGRSLYPVMINFGFRARKKGI